jgi:hypothetical protein
MRRTDKRDAVSILREKCSMKRENVIACVYDLSDGMILHDGDRMPGIADCVVLSSLFGRTTWSDDELVALPMRRPSSVSDCIIVRTPAPEYAVSSVENVSIRGLELERNGTAAPSNRSNGRAAHAVA